MSLEVFASVAAIVSAFHTAAELAARLEHKKWRRCEPSTEDDNDDEANRRKLQVSFETAESLIGFRYAADIDKVGDIAFGDDIGRDRLLHIALNVQANIVQSLELAVNYDNAVLDLSSLHEASILNRKDAIEALDELKQRVLLEHPLQRLEPTPRISRNARGSIISVLPSQSPTSTSHDPIPTSPPATSINIEKNELCRSSSTQRNGRGASINVKRSSRPASESINFNPALNYLLRGKNPEERQEAMKEIDELVAAYQELTTYGERDAALATLSGKPNVKRNPLGIQMVDANTRFAGFDENPLEMLDAIPTTPGGTLENPKYLGSSKKDSAIGEWIESSQTSSDARWSTTSSVYSDHAVTSGPPSLYRYSSTSSHESDILPASPPSPHHFSTHGSRSSKNSFWGPESLQTTNEKIMAKSRNESLVVAPLAVKSRPSTLKSLPSALKDKPLPPIHDRDSFSDMKSERGRIHLDPHDDFDRRSDSTLTIPTQFKTPSRSVTPASRNRTPVSHTPSHSRSRSLTPCFISTRAPPTEKMMVGRPSKDNNYWGFCKGAWGVRDDLKKGLGVETRPTGMYSSSQVWRCKQCFFEGPAFVTPHPTKKNKKETIVDPKIYTSSVGIRYRWIFLAKSHVKLTNMPGSNKPHAGTLVRRDSSEFDGCSFACLICSVERNISGVFGNVDTLMNHIFMEHARMGLADSVLKRSKCIFGRTAGADEDWDINLPNEDTCVVML